MVMTAPLRTWFRANRSAYLDTFRGEEAIGASSASGHLDPHRRQAALEKARTRRTVPVAAWSPHGNRLAVDRFSDEARWILEAMSRKDLHDGHLLERGDIFFIYRPRVGEEEPSGLGDVQRFFIVLRPEGARKLRLLVVGRKRLPDIGQHERHWGFVALVTDSAEAIERELRAEDYETKTRGEQHQPAARPAGEGVYAITLRNSQMHLSYVLELPQRPSDVQAAFKIAPEASFALSVKNPEKDQPPGTGLDEREKPDYPERLQREFRDRRFEREDVELLDFPGAEFILVGARTGPESTYGAELPVEPEDYEHAEIIRDLHMVRSRHPIEPLFEGGWK
jgi:hypothetical protein